jgi:predicted ArsR family transcriptional regulator
MKATELKYMLLLDRLTVNGDATHAELAEELDIPPSLVNRYLKRLAHWDALKNGGRGGAKYTLSPKGDRLLRQASWAFLAFSADALERLRERAVEQLEAECTQAGIRRVVLYGVTPLTQTIAEWAKSAGIEVVAVCDEECSEGEAKRLDELDRSAYDAFVLCDWDRAEDTVLLALLGHYAPVINLFAVDGAAAPAWR